jgi:hypothetical protein
MWKIGQIFACPPLPRFLSLVMTKWLKFFSNEIFFAMTRVTLNQDTEHRGHISDLRFAAFWPILLKFKDVVLCVVLQTIYAQLNKIFR